MIRVLIILSLVVAVVNHTRSVYAYDFSRPDMRILMDSHILKSPIQPRLISDQPFVPLRYICEKLGAHVLWNATTREIRVLINGMWHFPATVLRDGSAYVQAGLLRELLSLSVEYIREYNVLVLTTTGHKPSKDQILKLLPRYDTYNDEDLTWLSRIVEAEARGETYDSKLGVANVILNRVQYSSYPDTVKAVIFDRKSGVQFTPTRNGSINNNPSDESILAAIEALEGKNNAESALFFVNPRIATSTWIQENRDYAFTIGGHSYYY